MFLRLAAVRGEEDRNIISYENFNISDKKSNSVYAFSQVIKKFPSGSDMAQKLINDQNLFDVKAYFFETQDDFGEKREYQCNFTLFHLLFQLYQENYCDKVILAFSANDQNKKGAQGILNIGYFSNKSKYFHKFLDRCLDNLDILNYVNYYYEYLNQKNQKIENTLEGALSFNRDVIQGDLDAGRKVFKEKDMYADFFETFSEKDEEEFKNTLNKFQHVVLDKYEKAVANQQDSNRKALQAALRAKQQKR